MVVSRRTTDYPSSPAALFSHQEPNSMDRGASDYPQSGLQAPSYPASAAPQSEGSFIADQASAGSYPQSQEVRSSTFSSSATPTSDYGINPSSARSGTFPEYLRQPYHPSSTHSGSSGGMAQASSPPLPLADGRQNNNHAPQQIKSDEDVPIDPSIAASSPTYPPPPPQYSPYASQPHDMAQAYQPHPSWAGRPDWSQYGQAAASHGLPGPYSAHTSPSTTVSSASSTATAGARPGQVGGVKDQRRKRLSHDQQQNHPLSQVYSFVPIPGAQQHKRPRRRYEEIERMYKCGWNGCEKAYGTLNHLNAHVTMQGHGPKRTPEEFKEIRKEWKARKKEEEAQKKSEEDRQRQAAAATGQVEAQSTTDPGQAQSVNAYTPGVRPQLPPIGYQPAPQPVGHYPAQGGIDQMQPYSSGNQLYQNYPQSPYGQGNQIS